LLCAGDAVGVLETSFLAPRLGLSGLLKYRDLEQRLIMQRWTYRVAASGTSMPLAVERLVARPVAGERSLMDHLTRHVTWQLPRHVVAAHTQLRDGVRARWAANGRRRQRSRLCVQSGCGAHQRHVHGHERARLSRVTSPGRRRLCRSPIPRQSGPLEPLAQIACELGTAFESRAR